MINFFSLWFGQHRYDLPTCCLKVTRYELLCKLSSWDKSAASAIRLRDRHEGIFAEHFRFDDFSVEVLGRAGLRYREVGRQIFVDSAVLTGPRGMGLQTHDQRVGCGVRKRPCRGFRSRLNSESCLDSRAHANWNPTVYYVSKNRAPARTTKILCTIPNCLIRKLLSLSFYPVCLQALFLGR